MSKKVRCFSCDNELAGKCNIKKVKVKINKPRLCEDYKLNELKQAKVNTVTISAPPRVNPKKDGLLKRVATTGNPKHPLTGDLSRFTTTAKKED